LNDLSARQSELNVSNRTIVDQLVIKKEQTLELIAGIPSQSVSAFKVRHHGDLHLGQMLIVKDDILIIDFEGEPQRPPEERRRKRAAARDVAGVIRSIDYAATAALSRAEQVTTEGHDKIVAALDTWRDRSTAAFLAGYWENMTDQRLWPPEQELAERVLDFFLLEKAFYEIDYELANRPDWLHVPLMGVWRILSKHESAQS
jgi:maltose alpha-D-glucosyltransferase/alpha-amylase